MRLVQFEEELVALLAQGGTPLDGGRWGFGGIVDFGGHISHLTKIGTTVAIVNPRTNMKSE